MNIIELIFNLLFKKKTPEIIVGQNIMGNEVRTILSQFTTNLWISDDIFECVNSKNLRDFLIINDVNTLQYINEKRDCDDFAYMLEGDITRWYPASAVGILWGLNRNDVAHAWNFFIDENKKVKFIEPQGDIIFDPTNEEIWIMII
jgi:hypothetical protein